MKNSTWKPCTVGDVVELQRGYDLPEYERQPGTVPVIGSFGITGYHNTPRASGPGATVGRSGASFGVATYSPVDYWPHNAVLFVTDFKGNFPRFVFYLLKTIDFQSLNSGSAQPSLNRNYVCPVRTRIPSPQTQRKIAGFLSAYDDLIESNTRRIAIWEEMAQAIYREWFVNFRFPGHENVKLINSPLGKIPEGWKVGRLDDVLVLQRGFDLPIGQRLEGDVPVYAATGIVGTHNEAKVKGPGVLTGRSGSLGTVTYVHEDHWPLNTALWVKEFKKPSPLFAYYTLRSVDFSSFNSGAAVPTLNRNDIHGLPTLLPTDESIGAFHEIERPFFDAVRTLRKKTEVLRATRDLLLPKLISGQLDVEELDIETGQPLVEAQV